MSTLRKLAALTLVLGTSFAFAQQDGHIKNQAAQTAPAFKAKKLGRAEVDALLAKPDQVIIIDVRRPDELTAIGGFPTYLSVQAKELEKNIAFIPKDRTIITVSNHA